MCLCLLLLALFAVVVGALSLPTDATQCMLLPCIVIWQQAFTHDDACRLRAACCFV
jgi:hypothetical protein